MRNHNLYILILLLGILVMISAQHTMPDKSDTIIYYGTPANIPVSSTEPSRDSIIYNNISFIGHVNTLNTPGNHTWTS